VLLRPDHQYSTPWGAPDCGPCDKCGGAGITRYACRSCLERGADRDCPACHGSARFTDTCPACEGDGQIDRTTRDGVSVFPSFEGLSRYIAERDAETAGCIVLELEGELTGDVDLDADAGALLIRPTRVVGALPFENALSA
jgi:DnaJ-class molecular chaperone